MAFQINFMAPVQITKDGVLPTEGLPVANAADSSPQTVPAACQYVTISHDAAVNVSVSGLAENFPDVVDGKTFSRVNAGELSFPVSPNAVITVTE